MIVGAMTIDLWQDTVVTLAAAAAGVVIASRVFGFFNTRAREPRCANCQPNKGSCAPTARDGQSAGLAGAGTTHPAVFIRQPR
jgi:hypothetical protein